MARDYKHRAQNSSRNRKAPTVWWRWLLVAGLVVAFFVFLNMVRGMVAELLAGKQEESVEQPVQVIKQALPVQSPPEAEATKKTEP